MKFNRHNFYRNTFCIFEQVGPEAVAHLKPDYKSKSGSVYYFTKEGVYRHSNHWGRAAQCKWRLASAALSGQRLQMGFARWSDFQGDNDFEKLYYITIGEQDTVSYQHIGNLSETSSAPLLRTAPETIKRIRQMRDFIKNDSALDYRQTKDRMALKAEVLARLAGTNQSLAEILRQSA